MLEKLVAQRSSARGFALIDLTRSTRIARTKNPAECCGCDLRMAARLDTDDVLVSEGQKVSNLILSMNLVMREVERQAAVRALAVDIRSNPDQS